MFNLFKSHYRKEESVMSELIILSEKMEHNDRIKNKHLDLIKNIGNNINSAIWVKDIDNKFIFANNICKKDVLHCNKLTDITKLTDKDFINNSLSIACNTSDEIVKKENIAMRFIEHNDCWWDTLKSPFKDDNNILIGTIGIANNITNIIPQKIKLQFNKNGTIPINIDAILCENTIEKIINDNI